MLHSKIWYRPTFALVYQQIINPLYHHNLSLHIYKCYNIYIFRIIKIYTMAAFSYEKHHPFLLDSSSSLFLFPNTTSAPKLSHTINNSSNMSSFLEQQINNNYSPCFSPPHQHHPFYDQPDQTVEVSSWTSSVNISATSSIATKGTICTNNSSSSDVIARHQLINPIHNMKNSPQHSHSKMNGKKQRKASTNNSSIGEGCIMRSDSGEEKPINKKRSRRGDDQKKNDGQEIEKEAPTGYIHVRARRGQATDSHSLAERVRREKISKRMKLLQTLVPGCDKVTGKALMLDEIIKYVQSLQNQVEFLSMKIASVNPMLYDFGMDLDSVMVKPERMSSLEAAQQQDVQQQNNNQLDTNIFNTSGGYTLVDTSTLLQFQQAQMPNIMSHPQNNNGQLLWNTDEQKQKFISQSGFTNNSSSFHLQ